MLNILKLKIKLKLNKNIINQKKIQLKSFNHQLQFLNKLSIKLLNILKKCFW